MSRLPSVIYKMRELKSNRCLCGISFFIALFKLRLIAPFKTKCPRFRGGIHLTCRDD